MNTTEALNTLRDLEANFEDGGESDCAKRLRAASNALAEALNQHELLAALPVQPEPVREYFYKKDNCPAKASDSPGCICWHKEGTGPLANKPESIASWRVAELTIAQLALSRKPKSYHHTLRFSDGAWLDPKTGIEIDIRDVQLVQPANVESMRATEQWNIERDGNDLLVCFNDHEKGEPCEYLLYTLAQPVQPAPQPYTPLCARCARDNGECTPLGARGCEAISVVAKPVQPKAQS